MASIFRPLCSWWAVLRNIDTIMSLPKEYPCSESASGKCRYGGGKIFNHGFCRGVGAFCRHKDQKRFVSSTGFVCPLKRPPPVITGSENDQVIRERYGRASDRG
jgi:hypothetical protein